MDNNTQGNTQTDFEKAIDRMLDTYDKHTNNGLTSALGTGLLLDEIMGHPPEKRTALMAVFESRAGK